MQDRSPRTGCARSACRRAFGCRNSAPACFATGVAANHALAKRARSSAEALRPCSGDIGNRLVGEQRATAKRLGDFDLRARARAPLCMMGAAFTEPRRPRVIVEIPLRRSRRADRRRQDEPRQAFVRPAELDPGPGASGAESVPAALLPGHVPLRAADAAVLPFPADWDMSW